MDSSDDIYQLAGVSKTYRKSGREILAVRELDLDIRAGEWLAVQGKTGHGKTTLLQLLGGLDRPTQGRVTFAGQDLVAAPESIGAVKAALDNQMQRAVNIFLGSVLATIGLTIPSVLVINHLIDRPVVLGVEHTDLALLILTLALSMITFTSGRTNMLQGVVHLLLFAAYILLIFQA